MLRMCNVLAVLHSVVLSAQCVVHTVHSALVCCITTNHCILATGRLQVQVAGAGRWCPVSPLALALALASGPAQWTRLNSV
jgi:hypothetical protein